MRPDPDELGVLADQLDRRTWQMWEAIDAALMAEHPCDVSPVVAEELLGACRTTRAAVPDAVNTHTSRVSSLATLHICSGQVVARLQELPWQPFPPT